MPEARERPSEVATPPPAIGDVMTFSGSDETFVIDEVVQKRVSARVNHLGGNLDFSAGISAGT